MSGANSKTELPLQQSEWTKTAIKSVEVTVETDEVVHQKSNSVSYGTEVAAAPTEHDGENWS